MLNRTQVRNLFHKEAILINTRNVVPMYRAAEMFGEQAALFAYERGSVKGDQTDYGSLYGIGYFQLFYLTYRGFQAAATYVNIEEIYKSGRDHGRWFERRFTADRA